MSITADSIQQLKQIVNICEVVSSYIELRRVGANYNALCPFHSEKTPSFVVSERGFYKCYGCGEGGDAIDFIEKIEHLSFADALEKLADMYNFKLTYTNKKSDSSIHDALLKVAQFYQTKLDAKISAYLNARGVKNSSIEKFKLGFSGDGADLIAFLSKEKLPFDKLQEIGLITRRENRYYAKFFNRVMFPIFAPNNKVVGFGGRILEGDSAKYINSQQSKIFNKSQLLYGYNFARESIAKERKIIVVEGYLDVIMLSQAGFNNVVATLGTALTPLHLPLLSRGEAEILLCFDGDKAGMNAALKASKMLANKSGGVVIFKDGKDPADMVKEGRIAELIELFKVPVPFIEFVIRQIALNFDLNAPLQKEQAFKETQAFLSTLSPLLQDEYRAFSANVLQVAPYLFSTNSSAEANLKTPIYRAFGAEEVIIKSIYEDFSLLDIALEYIDENIFTHQKEAFCALMREDLKHKDLLGIIINPNISPLKIDDFRAQLGIFIANAYQKMLKNSRKNKQISLVMAIQRKIQMLKKGTLVRFEHDLVEKFNSANH